MPSFADKIAGLKSSLHDFLIPLLIFFLRNFDLALHSHYSSTKKVIFTPIRDLNFISDVICLCNLSRIFLHVSWYDGIEIGRNRLPLLTMKFTVDRNNTVMIIVSPIFCEVYA